MLQRIQTVYLILALGVTVACLSLPIGYLIPEGMGGNVTMFNLWKIEPEGGLDFSVWPLFALLLVTCPLNLLTIFAYSNRKLQSSLCLICICLVILWIAAYAFYGFVAPGEEVSFKMAFAACLPLIAIVFYALARHGILSDERLVRSMDRIR